VIWRFCVNNRLRYAVQCCIARVQVPTHIRAGVIVVALGLLPWVYTTYRVYSHNWIPLLVPVALTPREFESPEFTTDLTGTYVVSLVFEPMPDGKKEDCQIGEELGRGSCAAAARTLYLDWSVFADGKDLSPAATYKPYAFSGSPGELGTEIGRFEGTRGHRQAIRLDILNDAGELNSAHPKLRVEAHRVYWEEWVIFRQLAFFCAVLFAAVGLAVVFLPLWLRRRTKSDSHYC